MRHSLSQFPDPVFLPHCPGHGAFCAVVALRHCLPAPSAVRLGERALPGGDKKPEISVPAAREYGEKEEASTGSSGESLPLLPHLLAERWGIWEQGQALPIPLHSPFPGALDAERCPLQPARPSSHFLCPRLGPALFSVQSRNIIFRIT